jgi:hypothetical protein
MSNSPVEPHGRRDHRRPEEGYGGKEAFEKEKQRQFRQLEKNSM